MTAVLIPTSSEAEWLELRRLGITASEIAVIMGLSPYSSPYALYHQKLGTLDPPEDTEAMALGRFLEGYVCDRFAEKHPEFRVEGNGRELWQHSARPWQMATPDRVVYEFLPLRMRGQDGTDYGPPLAVHEAKTAASYDGWGEGGSDEIPVHYRCQVLWQCRVLGVQNWFLTCLFLHSRTLRVYEGVIDDGALADLELMEAEALAFLKRLETGEEPGVDHRHATLDALKALHPSLEDRRVVVPARLAARYRAACKAVKKAEQRKALAENQIRARLGSAQAAYDGATAQLLATRQVYDVPARTVERKAFTVDKLMPAKPKEVKTS